PDEVRRLVALVRHRLLQLERLAAQAHDPLEPERRLPAARPEPNAVLDRLVLPRQRRHLAVERDPPPTVGARLVHAREELLPAALVVPEELVVAAPFEGRSA